MLERIRRLIHSGTSKTTTSNPGASRHLRFEQCEDRRLLASMADILFLVDESGTEQDTHTQDWLATVVDDLHTALTADDIDAQYGLIGFGEGLPPLGEEARFAHTQLLGPAGSKEDWTTSETDLANAMSNDLAEVGAGPTEDGWDAIEHAIAEYDFREGSVPLIVLVQGDQGRTILNDTLTRTGNLAALKSKNAILNSIVAGELLADGQPPTGYVEEPLFFRDGPNRTDPPLDPQPTVTWAPIFDLAPYGLDQDIYVLGVETDAADGVRDWSHDFHWFDTDTINTTTDVPVATTADALQVSYNGSNTGATGMVGTGKSILIGRNITGGIGPTTEGYRAKSVPFAFEDLIDRGTGDPISGATKIANVSESNHLSTTALGSYEVDFYGTLRDELYIHSDGYLTFQSSTGYSTTTNADLTQGGGIASQPMIAPLWDNLVDSGTPGSIVWQVKDSGLADERLVVQWEQLTYAPDSTTFDPVTFQAVLYADGRIRFNYLDLSSYPNSNGELTIENTGGVGATVGIWSGSADPITLAAETFVPGPHSIQTDTSGETSDSYVRMAWDTGGAAWDVGLVDRFGATSPEANALRDAFIGSLSDQILRADAAGKVFHNDNVLLALNLGNETGDIDAGTAGIFHADNGDYTSDGGAGAVDSRSTASSIDVGSTNSIPAGTSTALEQVFQSARGEEPAEQDSLAENISFTIDKFDLAGTPTDLTNGSYIVELFFAEYGNELDGFPTFDVVLEGKTVLNDYTIFHDHAKIEELTAVENDSAEALSHVGLVKRFRVDVTGGDGLQIDLLHEGSLFYDPLLSAVRVLQADPPRVKDVVIKGSTWAPGVEYAFSQIVAAGEQLRPIPTQNADTLEIHFDSPVTIPNGMTDALKLRGLNNSIVPIQSFAYDQQNYIATWTFDPADFQDDKFAIHLLASEVTGGGQLLDGDWHNPDYGTPDYWIDDVLDPDFTETFVTGHGTAGSTNGEFRFHFALLAGDYDGDGIVETNSESATGDGDGDGDSGDNDDLAIGTDGDRLPLRAVSDADFSDDEIVDAFDLARWEENYGKSVTVVHEDGDANGDGKVDAIDLALWDEQQGNPPPAEFSADFDGDGDVDGADMSTCLENQGLGYGDADGDTWVSGVDFLIWQRKYGLRSAWYVPWETGLAALTVEAAPTVDNVIISGSQSMHDPFSFDTVDGSGNQLATVPVGGADTISIVFSENVNVSADSLKVIGLTRGNLPTLAEFDYDAATFTATWRFENWTMYGDNYLISLTDAVTDVDGNLLDGEWVNPASITTSNALVSEFPSGDGEAGGAFDFAMTLLPGDADLDGDVDGDDFSILSANLFQFDKLFVDGDFNGDGTVDITDFGQLKFNLQANLQDLFILADLNGDFDVDSGDLMVLNNNFGMTDATYEDGDLNGDGIVDEADLDLAFAQFGLALDLAA